MRTPRSIVRPAQHIRGRHWIIAVALLICLIVLALTGVISIVLPYSAVRAEATDGVVHLKHAQALLAPLLKQPGIPEPSTLHSVAGDLSAAERDFARTRRDLGAGVFSLAGGAASPAKGSISAAAALAAMADEACLAGLDLLGTADTLLPVLHGGFMGSDAPPAQGTASAAAPAPAITAAMLQSVTAAYEDAVRHLSAVMAYASQADLSALPSSLVSRQQLADLRSAIAQWPRIQPQLVQVDGWLHVAPTLLGVQAPERLLVELMDRGELRTTGGFIGDYGVMTIQDGRTQPFTLNDIQTLDRPYDVRMKWPPPPTAYSWWPMAGFGLRDSNLSPDFPTAARLATQMLAKERRGPQVQGVLAFNVVAMERVLSVVGPIAVPEYHTTATAQNLESLIRRYTETTYLFVPTLHEKFTADLGHAFMNKLHDLQGPELAGVAKSLLVSLHTKDIQLYLTDPAAEALLAQQGLDSSMAHGPGDAITIVDSNVTGNKVNVIASVTYKDAVSLDAQGTATHHLTITYGFDSSKHPGFRYFLFGRDYYLTYLRIYAPASARLVSYDGFNGAAKGDMDLQIGVSDEPGHQMWGGYVYVPDGTPHTLQFVWSVPAIATRDSAGRLRYTLTFQHQASSTQRLDLTVTAPGTQTPSLVYYGPLDQDHSFFVAS